MTAQAGEAFHHLGLIPPETRTREVLEAADEFFFNYLRRDDGGYGVRRYLRKRAIEADDLDRFGVGYSPVGRGELAHYLEERGFSLKRMHVAGLARRSVLHDQIYDHFRSRIMFPVRLHPGEPPIGFYALAIHSGPSWPRWLTSPSRPHFENGAAVFGVDVRGDAIAAGGPVVAVDDCIDVLYPQSDDGEVVVGVVRSKVTSRHRAWLEHLGAAAVRRRTTSHRIRAGGW